MRNSLQTKLRLIAQRLASSAACLIATAGLASAQTFPSDPMAMFVPDDLVPLSEFKNVQPGTTVTFHVRDEILTQYSASVQIAYIFPTATGGVLFSAPQSVMGPSGQVVWQPGPLTAGVYAVVVTSALTNDFPILTHWDSTRNGGRGGQSPGASDGIQSLEVNSSRSEILSTGPTILNGDPTHNLGGDPYLMFYYATDQWALFSDGSGQMGHINRPRYERYVAENWTLASVSELAAIWLSDWSRSNTGLPIAHVNAPTSLSPPTTGADPLQSNLPLIQLVHAYIVRNNDDTSNIGYEDSLATFILPPMWERNPASPYTVALSSGYDLHGGTFLGAGPHLIEPIGNLYVDSPLLDRRVVGIIMNGGGTRASLTQQASIYGSTTKLFSDGQSHLGLDPHKVVTWGGSRGGTAAIGLAGHPNNGFKATYVVATGPTLYAGETIHEFSNPSYPYVQVGLASSSGFARGWEHDFILPTTLPIADAGKDAEQLTARTVYGTDVFSDIDGVTSTSPMNYAVGNSSDVILDRLKLNGTKVVLQVSSHDTARPFSHSLRYFEALENKGIPVRFEVGYRFGHGAAVNLQPDLETLLDRTIRGIHTAFNAETGTVFSHPTSELERAVGFGYRFTPGTAPVILEMPYSVFSGEEVTYTIAGPPGTPFAVLEERGTFDLATGFVPMATPAYQLMFTGTLPQTGVATSPNYSALIKPYTHVAGPSGYTYRRIHLYEVPASGPSLPFSSVSPSSYLLPDSVIQIAVDPEVPWFPADVIGLFKGVGQGLSTD